MFEKVLALYEYERGACTNDFSLYKRHYCIIWKILEFLSWTWMMERSRKFLNTLPKSMLLDLRVLMISSWEASPNCLVRFSDMLWRPKPSLWKAPSGWFSSGVAELDGECDRLRWAGPDRTHGKPHRQICVQNHFNGFNYSKHRNVLK